MDPIQVKTEKIREWSNEYRLIQPDAVRGMVTSMQSGGQLQPIILQKQEQTYNIIDGIKRYRAALELGVEALQAFVFEVDAVMAKAMIIHYNLRSSSLSMYEQGLIVSSLVREHKISQKEVSRLLRQSHSWVCRRLGMIERLLPEVQHEIRMGSISVSHGRELVKLPRGNQRQALAVVVKEGLSSRECAIVVDKLLKSSGIQDTEYIYKHSREVIRQVVQRDKFYDSRLSDHGNQVLKSRELLRLQVNIMSSVLQSVHTEKLSGEENDILLPGLEELLAPMSRLIEIIKKLKHHERRGNGKQPDIPVQPRLVDQAAISGISY
jgi:ParB/RepB/Spo0J family partition protein